MITRRMLFSGAAARAFAAPRRRPNVVLYLPDQLRAQSVGCYSNPQVRTPEVDRLAGEGLTFNHTIANSPVCCPARAILMTGQYCHRNGMVANDLRLREERQGLAEVFRENGYRTGFIGKWHLDGGARLPGFVPPGPRRQGFEYWAANQCSHAHFDNTYFRDAPEPRRLGKYEAEGWTDLALEFLDEAKRDPRPFFLCVFPGPPHDPYGAPEPYMRQYDPAKVTLPRNHRPGERVPGAKELAAYYAATTAIDEQAGRLTRELDARGLGEDTAFLFSSDHGDMLGCQGERLKRKPWEESIRVPGVLRYPRVVKKARREDALFSHVDFAPTLLGLSGIRAPAAFQGVDFSPLVAGRKMKTPDAALLQIFGPYQGDGTPDGWRGVRTARHTYARFRNKPWVLYDNRDDPQQLHNLAADPAAEALRRDLDSRLEAWMKRTGDSWEFNWTAPVEDNGRLYRDRAWYTVAEYLASGAR